MSVSSWKKKEDIFLCRLFCWLFCWHLLGFISMYSVLKTLSEYTYFYIYIKKWLLTLFYLLWKLMKAFTVSLRTNIYSFTSYQKTLFYTDYRSISIDQNNILSNILYIYRKTGVTWTYFWYILWSPDSLQPLSHLTPRI